MFFEGVTKTIWRFSSGLKVRSAVRAEDADAKQMAIARNVAFFIKSSVGNVRSNVASGNKAEKPAFEITDPRKGRKCYGQFQRGAGTPGTAALGSGQRYPCWNAR